MKFFIFDLKTTENTQAVIHKIVKDLKTKNFKIHNARPLQLDKGVYRFNIVTDNEFNSVLSREMWFKLNQGFVCTKNNILIINEFNHEVLLERFKQDFFTLFDFDFVAKGCDKDFFLQIIGDKSHYVNEVTFINEDAEIRKESVDFENLVYEDINVLEISYFDKSNSLIRYTCEGVFYCHDEEMLYKNLGIFKKSVS